MSKTVTAVQPIAEHSRYQPAAARLAELEAECGQKRARVAELEAKLGACQQRQRDQIDAEALALVEGIPADVVDVKALAEELAQCRRRVHVLDQAVTMQRRALEPIVRQLSDEACRKVAAEHRKRVERLARALVEFAAASEAEEQLRREIEEAGYLVRTDILRPMGIPWLGTLRDHDSRVAMWIREAIEFGLLPADWSPVAGTNALERPPEPTPPAKPAPKPKQAGPVGDRILKKLGVGFAPRHPQPAA